MIGEVSPDQRLEHMVLVLRPDSAQTETWQELIRAQQDHASPYYHQWLTPEAFGERFGVSQNDLARVVNWLRMQGMKVRSRRREDGNPGRGRKRHLLQPQQHMRRRHAIQ